MEFLFPSINFYILVLDFNELWKSNETFTTHMQFKGIYLIN